jgi:hypothetical protein
LSSQVLVTQPARSRRAKMGYTVPVLIAVASAIRRPYQPSPSTSAASTDNIGIVIRVMGWMLVTG